MRLPIEDVLPALRAWLTASANVVLRAPPGAGKTTLVPLAVLDEPWLAGHTMVMLEPRRLAARAAAARMAELRGERVGATVGYRIRLDNRVSGQTRIEVVTEGILTRRLQSDPALEGVGLVIFDEFHERHLHSDLALALCLDAQRGLRDDLRILVMSATLDTVPIARLLGDAPIIASEGRSYPVTLRYAARDPDRPLGEAVAAGVLDALAHDAGDVLAFLPGAGEIRRAEELLLRADTGAVIHPLYGDLPKEAQDRAIRPDAAGRRKIVLATPIAETSLTIEGVGIVIDSGYRRAPRFDPRSGLTRLETVRIARDAAEQRAGRAGRLGPGVCYRLWSEATDRGLVPRTAPEIRSADLTELALELAAWGVADAASLAWLDPPPPPALAQARELLTALGALDAAGRITDIGRRMAALPAHPRLARMLLASSALGLAPLACDLAALIGERDILTGERQRAADLALRIDALQAHRAQGPAGARAHGADAGACARVEQAARQLRSLLDVTAAPARARDADLGLLAAFAYPDRIAAQREPGAGRYLLANGRGALLADAGFRPALMVAVELDAGQGEGRVYRAAPLAPADLYAHFAAGIREETVVRWDPQREGVLAQHEERFGAILLAARPARDADPERIADALIAGIRSLGLAALPWSEAAREWQARVASVRAWFPEEDWPDVADSALLASLEVWLKPYLTGRTSRTDLARLDLPAILQAQLAYPQQRRLDELAPTHLTVPSGSRIRLAYGHAGESPVLAVKLQELFGLAETPRVAGGRIPVTLHLLSPARRPIQVTQDLGGFWARTYPEVKKELKGRYPKHPWPDDPWSARPSARTTARDGPIRK